MVLSGPPPAPATTRASSTTVRSESSPLRIDAALPNEIGRPLSCHPVQAAAPHQVTVVGPAQHRQVVVRVPVSIGLLRRLVTVQIGPQQSHLLLATTVGPNQPPVTHALPAVDPGADHLGDAQQMRHR